MTELIENGIQLAVVLGCCVYAGVMLVRSRDQVWFLLTCFYGSFALGLIYWLLYIAFFSKTPPISPVSDLSWLASVLFLLVLQNTLRLPEEGAYRPLAAWLAPVVSTLLCFFLFQWGDYFLNTLWAIVMGTCGYCALRGLLFARRQDKSTSGRQYLHMSVLTVILLEYCLWIVSCYWEGSSLSNPYFWFDMLQTLSFLTMIPALKKAVEI